ncbi:LIM-domain binding protein [Mycena galericulata]|nr:LIM-domain binding protein [Mycena galericulata]
MHRRGFCGPGHPTVKCECESAVWTHRYNTGHIVTLRGRLTACFVICTTAHAQVQKNGAPPGPYVLNFDYFEFEAYSHDTYIALDGIAGSRKAEKPAMNGSRGEEQWEEPRLLIGNASIPGEPINAFCIPQATMRFLELAESFISMEDLILFAKEQDLEPFNALKSLADKIRKESPYLRSLSPQQVHHS